MITLNRKIALQPLFRRFGPQRLAIIELAAKPVILICAYTLSYCN